MVAILHIHLLGNFSLLYGDKLITGVNTARLQALLAYLVLHHQAPQARQHLAFLFWPDTSEAQALTNLRNLLYKLRHALPTHESFLSIDTQTMQWRSDAPFKLDVDDFEAALTQATTRAELEAALKHYRGDLLPSCYDDWIVSIRQHLRQQAVGALVQLIGLLETEHAYRIAIDYGQQLLQLDPYNEMIYGRLMKLYAADGDRAGMVRIYQSCAMFFQNELGTEPAPTTQELYQRLLHTPPSLPIHPSLPMAVHTNLPFPVSSFIGRQREMTVVKVLLTGDDAAATAVERNQALFKRQPTAHKLVTLTGTGGSGKTRLALRIATDLVKTYPDGVWWVELVSLLDGSLVPQTVAKTLGINERPNEAVRETLAQFLHSKQLLLVLDNCEHLVDACAQLSYTLMSRCPKLQILTTSREPLGITGEQVYPVPTLSLPDPQIHTLPASLLNSEAICLFVERTQAIDARFELTEVNAPTVLHICRRLDGIPLAIELAAARMRVIAVEQIAERLDDYLNLLTTGGRTAPPRHQTLRATMDWSYELLTDDERLLLRQLAIFAGSFSLEAIEAVCDSLQTSVLDTLARLVDKSLVTVERDDGEVQYRLFETIRTYAREKLLASGEVERLRIQHLHFYIQLAETANAHLHGLEQEHWLARLETIQPNVRLALRRALEQGKSVEALRLSGAMGLFWVVRGYWREGCQWLKQALALSTETRFNVNSVSTPSGWSALALWRAGELLWRQCDFAGARACMEESLTLYRALADRDSSADVLGLLGGVAFEQGEYATAQTFYEESLALGYILGSQHRIGMSLFGLGLVAYHQGDYTEAQALLTQSLQLLRESERRLDTSYALNALGNVANLQGNYRLAQTFYAECLNLRREFSYKRGVAATLNDIANATAKQGDAVTASAHYKESLLLFRELSNQRGMVWALAGLARLRHAQNDLLLAAKLLGAVEAHLIALSARLDEPEHSDNARAVALLRTQLDKASLHLAWEAGQHLTMEQAITLALQSE